MTATYFHELFADLKAWCEKQRVSSINRRFKVYPLLRSLVELYGKRVAVDTVDVTEVRALLTESGYEKTYVEAFMQFIVGAMEKHDNVDIATLHTSEPEPKSETRSSEPVGKPPSLHAYIVHMIEEDKLRRIVNEVVNPCLANVHDEAFRLPEHIQWNKPTEQDIIDKLKTMTTVPKSLYLQEYKDFYTTLTNLRSLTMYMEEVHANMV